ncbi:MAG TPA: hypothetical protein VGM39_13280 [Kofleriaceae bacterium]|jgi:hypothetical protein
MKRALLAVMLLTSIAHADEEEGEPKLSLPTEADRTAWLKSGFRLELGAEYGFADGLRGAPDGTLKGVVLRAGWRLDRDWSLLFSFDYASASGTGPDLSGLKFAGTLDPTWHVTRWFSLAVGAGFGGIVESGSTRADPDPLGDSLETSYTFPNARTPLPECSGVGYAGRLRAQWQYVLGPRSSATVSLEGFGQWTGCVSDTGRTEPDTGNAIVRRQFWPHVGGTLQLGVTFR